MLFGLAGVLALLPTVQATSRDVSVRQLVPNSESALDAGVGDRLVLRLPADQRAVRLSASAVLALIRRAAPGLSIQAMSDDVVITSARAPSRFASCKALSRPIAAGEIITRDDVSDVPCGEAVRAALRRDRGSGVLSAARDLPVGEPLGRTGPFGGAAIARGATLTLRSRVGPVAIERPVATLQPARSGGRVFVRDESGTVFSAPLALETGQ